MLGKPGSWGTIARAIGIALTIFVAIGVTTRPDDSHAQLRIEGSGVGGSQIPISISPFIADPKVPIDISSVVRSDLERSGAFRLIAPIGPNHRLPIERKAEA